MPWLRCFCAFCCSSSTIRYSVEVIGAMSAGRGEGLALYCPRLTVGLETPRRTALCTPSAERLAANGAYLAVARLNIPRFWSSLCSGDGTSSVILLSALSRYLATEYEGVATAELNIVVILLSTPLLLRQLLVGHVATGAGSAGSATRNESRVTSRNLRLGLSPVVQML